MVGGRAWAMRDSNTPQNPEKYSTSSKRDAQSDALGADMQYLKGVWDRLPELTRQFILSVAKQSLSVQEKG